MWLSPLSDMSLLFRSLSCAHNACSHLLGTSIALRCHHSLYSPVTWPSSSLADTQAIAMQVHSDYSNRLRRGARRDPGRFLPGSSESGLFLLPLSADLLGCHCFGVGPYHKAEVSLKLTILLPVLCTARIRGLTLSSL